MGVKATQLFGWEHEPSEERATSFGTTTAFGTTTSFGMPTTFGTTMAYRSEDRASQESQFGMSTAPDSWSARRDPAKASDVTLSPLAEKWVDRLPVATQPMQLCLLYPRITNRLALCWPDRVLTAHLFESLFSPKRGGRRGFPPVVLAELSLLRKYSATRAA